MVGIGFKRIETIIIFHSVRAANNKTNMNFVLFLLPLRMNKIPKRFDRFGYICHLSKICLCYSSSPPLPHLVLAYFIWNASNNASIFHGSNNAFSLSLPMIYAALQQSRRALLGTIQQNTLTFK